MLFDMPPRATSIWGWEWGWLPKVGHTFRGFLLEPFTVRREFRFLGDWGLAEGFGD